MSIQFAVNTNALKGMTYPEMAKLAAELGLDGIEWGLPRNVPLEPIVKEMAKVTKDAGLKVVGYINAALTWKTDALRRCSEAIATVGGNSLRVEAAWVAYNFNESLHQKDSYMDLFKRTRDGMEKLVPLGEEFGIRYVMETHGGGMIASPAMGRWMLDGMNPRYVGILFDPANGVAEGFLRPRHAVEILGPYLAYVHGKNLILRQTGQSDDEPQRAVWGHEKCLLDAGVVDFVELFFALKTVGYNGWVSFEEFFKDAPAEELKKALQFCRECLAAAPDGPQEPFTTFND
ncbi:MAG: sugar phosphate isomerase/epimerase [Phycisphaerae bacterium]|nr:sugar phosphate isomerase/epimerase [Phycisphaerae bacterium]